MATSVSAVETAVDEILVDKAKFNLMVGLLDTIINGDEGQAVNDLNGNPIDTFRTKLAVLGAGTVLGVDVPNAVTVLNPVNLGQMDVVVDLIDGVALKDAAYRLDNQGVVMTSSVDGDVTTYEVTLNSVAAAYADIMGFVGIIDTDGTATCEINVTGAGGAAMGVKDIIDTNSNDITLNDIKTGMRVKFLYNAAADKIMAVSGFNTMKPSDNVAAIILQHVTASAVNGGDTIAGINTRPLNTVFRGGDLVILSANRFKILKLGPWGIEGYSSTFVASRVNTLLYNVTQDELVINFGTCYQATGDSAFNQHFIYGDFEVGDIDDEYEIRHMIEASSTNNGFGQSGDFGIDNIFAEIRLKKA